MTRRLSVMPEVKDVGHEVLGSTERAKLRANANFATFSPFGASTITSRSCGLWRMHAVGRQFGLASAPKIAHWVQTMRVVRTSIARPPPPAISLMPIFSGPRKKSVRETPGGSDPRSRAEISLPLCHTVTPTDVLVPHPQLAESRRPTSDALCHFPLMQSSAAM
jgi:hypothetical protein